MCVERLAPPRPATDGGALCVVVAVVIVAAAVVVVAFIAWIASIRGNRGEMATPFALVAPGAQRCSQHRLGRRRRYRDVDGLERAALDLPRRTLAPPIGGRYSSGAGGRVAQALV